MSNTLHLIATLSVLAVCITAAILARRWMKHAETAAKEANLAYFRAHDSAVEAEQNANRT